MAKFRANPVIVEATIIKTVGPHRQGVPLQLILENGNEFFAEPELTARYFPKEGDYVVVQDDGYKYLNPKDVFERKYSPI